MAWVTDYTNKYRFDLFFRTEVNVIALQVLFVMGILISVLFAFKFVYKDITKVPISAVFNGTNVDSIQIVVGSLEYLSSKNLPLIVASIILITILFGYLIAKVTLIPARDSLNTQKQFIGNIAHELRTPLSIIKTNNEVLLLQDDLDVDLTRKMIRSNIEELDRISDTIDNLISFNSLYARPERRKLEKVNLGKLVDIAVERLKIITKSKHLTVNVKKRGYTTIEGKTTALEQIILNILKNAINYTPKGGFINIFLEPDYLGFVELRIEDSGIGIDRNDLFHVFEPFYRADKSRSRTNGSSGLGLAIVNELVKLHNGKIFVKSALKQGTSVTVSFPAITEKDKLE